MNKSVSIVGCYGFPIGERAGFERVSGDLARARNVPSPRFPAIRSAGNRDVLCRCRSGCARPVIEKRGERSPSRSRGGISSTASASISARRESLGYSFLTAPRSGPRARRHAAGNPGVFDETRPRRPASRGSMAWLRLFQVDSRRCPDGSQTEGRGTKTIREITAVGVVPSREPDPGPRLAERCPPGISLRTRRDGGRCGHVRISGRGGTTPIASRPHRCHKSTGPEPLENADPPRIEGRKSRSKRPSTWHAHACVLLGVGSAVL
jgi:hypothetical protein